MHYIVRGKICQGSASLLAPPRPGGRPAVPGGLLAHAHPGGVILIPGIFLHILSVLPVSIVTTGGAS